MKRNFFKGAALAAIALVGFTATAQEEESKGIELTGSVDAYFRANINGRNGSEAVAPASSFANQDGFALGFVNLIASKQVGKVGFVADLGFGPRGADAVFGSQQEIGGEIISGNSTIVNQLYVSYAASDAVTLTFGNFNTFLGYEVISPTGNFNYSTSYLFSFGPFSHTGLKADFAIDDNWSIMASVMNSTDFTDFNANGRYTGGLQLGYSDDAGSAYLNFLYGRQGESNEETFQVDLTTGWDLAEDFYLGLNASYNTTKDAGFDEDSIEDGGFYGVALYPQYAISENFTLGLRLEYFAQLNGGLLDFETLNDAFDAGTLEQLAPSDVSPTGIDLTNGEGSVFATTLTGSYTSGALTIKPELRLDAQSEDFFVGADGDVEKSLASFVLGAIYSF